MAAPARRRPASPPTPLWMWVLGGLAVTALALERMLKPKPKHMPLRPWGSKGL